VFLEQFRVDFLSEVADKRFEIKQTNTSVSRRGVVRGIHFADVPLGQAKFVFVPHGSIIDYVVDLRVGSPTFGKWESKLLDSQTRNAMYLSEGLGHAFVSLEDNTVVTYLVSEVFNPEAEHGINPLDSDISLVFPESVELIFSEKDAQAPSLAELHEKQKLPTAKAVSELHSKATY
jgi:dTDP-4-dehydrorhamnose 3,5-epimerase